MKLTVTQLSDIKNLVQHFAANFPRDEIKKKLERIDVAYHMMLNEEVRNESIEKKEEDIEYSERFQMTDLPIVRKQVQSEIPFLENIFLTDDPIFAVITTGLPMELQGAAEGINSKIRIDAQVSNWSLELTKFIQNSVKYNLSAVEVAWDTKVMTRKARNMTSGTKMVENTVEWAGNKIKAPNPYNLIFDTSVDPWQVASEGEFAGYVESLSHTRLATLWKSLKAYADANPEGDIYLTPSTDFWTATDSKGGKVANNLHHYIPKITSEPEQHGGTNWAKEFGNLDTSEKKYGNPGASYTLVKMYIRFVPLTLGIDIGKSEEDNLTPQVWCVYMIGGDHIVAVVPATNSHGLIPMAISTPDMDTLGIHGRSSLSCTVEIQKLAVEFMERRLAGIDRSINDRAIVDDRYLDRDMFSKRVSDGKFFPNSAYRSQSKVGLSQIYHHLPYQDETGSLLSNEIPFLMNLAEETNLSNASRYGKFQKGNKTPDEVRETLANAEAPLIRRAVQIEQQAFYVIKFIIQSNLIDYAEPEQFEDTMGQPVEFDPETLLKKTMKFKLSGGLDPLSVAMRQGLLAEIFQLAQTAPIINERYNLMQVFEDMYYARGLELSRYRNPVEQQVAPPAGNDQGESVPS